LKETGKPVVFVNLSGSAIGFEWEAANIPAILQAWYAGQSGGDAVADILFGDYNPAGRLPVTFYKNVNDLPDFEDYSMSNRTYRYFKGDVLYPFGFGLSYTSFSYGNLNIPASSKANTNINVQVNVTNRGKLNGEEVVQLYVSGKDKIIKTPIRSLKGFQRIYLKAGETKTVSFKVSAKDLSVIDDKGKMVPLRGAVIISVGGCQPSENLVKEKKVAQKIIKRA
jgi:beta-glucosidase